MNSVFANVIAGLGLFFAGLRMVDANLRRATGRRLRTVIGRLTQRVWVASLIGLLTGALVQSSSGIVFILVSLVSSGLTTVRRALPIVTWANVGCCALIFVAVLDLRLAILYLVGLAGAASAFDRSHRSDILGAVFGIGMLFFGIELMKTGAEPMQEAEWAPALLSGSSYAAAFVVGVAFSFITQSSTAVSLLAIGFAQTGLLGPFVTMIALYGANLGSTFSRMVLSSTLRGSVRQLTAYQDLFKLVGAAIFLTLLYLEAQHGVPLVRAFVSSLSGRVDRQMALVFLLFNLVTAVLFTMFQPWIVRLLEWWLPADMGENESTPQFLYDEALEEPAAALDLLEKEQIRLATRLRRYPEAMRAPVGSPQRQEAVGRHERFAALAGHIEHFQQALLAQPLQPGEMEQLTRLQGRISLLMYLEDSLRTMVSATEGAPAGSEVAERVGMFIEALDFVLLTLVDAFTSREPVDLEMLLHITEDRGSFVERIRHDFLVREERAGQVDRATILQVTNTFERAIWITNRLARLIERAAAPASASGLASSAST